MRIVKDQIVADYPALAVRTFLRRYRSFTIVAATAAYALKTDENQAMNFLRQLASLDLVQPAECLPLDKEAYEITTHGNAFANASAAKPISRKTAELVLQRLMERVRLVNDNPDLVYRVESVVLFGSMLSTAERLGDVDIAIELQAKVTEETAFRKWCDERRHIALEQGRHFSSTFEWVVWPSTEISFLLKARSHALSLHEFSQLGQMAGVRYRVLWGDAERIAGLIPEGQPA
jgi:predicted nucleotidyltransferase